MRWFERIVPALIVLAIVAGPACAAERLALLIGNQAYNAKVGPLKNPHNDIALIGAALRLLKFKVTEIKDADYGTIDKAINRHVQNVRREGRDSISFVYYAGHGAANPDTKINYLIPVDVANAEDDELWTNSINLNRVVEALREQAPSATHYVVFDACRNELNLTHKGKRALADRGFVPLAYTPGVMIAYATAPGKTATDAGVGAGIYAKALAEEIVKPGLEAVTMFRRVALRVHREIGQDPWMAASTLPEVYFAGVAATPPPPGVPPTQPLLGDASREWSKVDKRSIAELETFVRRHGSSLEADYARARLQELKQQQIAIAVPPPAVKPALEASPAPAPGAVFKDCPDCPEMVVVPAGSFTMGSPAAEIAALTKKLPDGKDYWNSEGPQRRVTIRHAFAVGKFEVTFAEWDACVSGGGCKHQPGDEGWGRGKRPVINVSWYDAKEYVAWLSRKTGRAYRLLSEAEWEYATRAGTTTKYAFGDTISKSQAEFSESAATSAKQSVEVGRFQANRFGLHDMHGNVWEWVEDNVHANYLGGPDDGSVWHGGDTRFRVLRGGSWGIDPDSVRSACRDWGYPTNRGNYLGFRLARTL